MADNLFHLVSVMYGLTKELHLQKLCYNRIKDGMFDIAKLELYRIMFGQRMWKIICFSLGFGDVCFNQGVTPATIMLPRIKERILIYPSLSFTTMMFVV